MSVWVAGRQVYVNTQNTQTVKICTPRNRRGQYERYYRIQAQYALTQREMENAIGRFSTLDDLCKWLVADRHAQRETDKETKNTLYDRPDRPPDIPFDTLPSASSDASYDAGQSPISSPESLGPVGELLELIGSPRYSPDDDRWLPQARTLVEQSIDHLLEEFLRLPYLHRVEHSIHAQLFHIMMGHPLLAQRVPLGNDLAKTQLVHKEWPESIARQEGNRRGSFDLAVLSPNLLRGCPSIEAFRHGHLHAPIVIEMGLDYNARHLAEDALKLVNSRPKHAYLIHLVRESLREPDAEQIILEVEAKLGIKSAYAWTAGGRTAVKLVNDKSIRDG